MIISNIAELMPDEGGTCGGKTDKVQVLAKRSERPALPYKRWPLRMDSSLPHSVHPILHLLKSRILVEQ
jgi:hypothetical protein